MTIPDEPTFRARPTTYKGVRMRSRLEASVAAFLDRERVAWTYEEPGAFADERGQYLPDFRVVGLTGSWPLYVEVKGPRLDPQEEADVFDRMSIIWSSEPAVLAVWTADLFGVEGRFPARLADGRAVDLRVGRCGPCGAITLRRGCPICGRNVEPVSPLIEVRDPAA